MKVIILAGGGGTRLFPLSRTSFPKQFLKIAGEQSLLVQSVQRFSSLVNPSDIVVVTNEEYFYHVKSELASYGASNAHILLEPVARNTAPAIALAARYCIDKLDSHPDETIFISTSDHIIRPENVFIQNIRQGIQMASEEKIVTFGVKPDKPETGYGYIQVGQPSGDGYLVEAFHEKPDKVTAERYLASGKYYWNSGMFAFTIGRFINELQLHCPDVYKLSDASFEETIEQFDQMPNVSFDYAVAEKSVNLVIVPLTVFWSDIGSWDAIYDILDKDTERNAISGDCISIGCTNTLMLGHNRLIAGIGLEDLLVVESDDVIVVAKKGESQKVKDLVNELKKQGRREANEHTASYRPWGKYSVLGEGAGYKIKKICVNTGQKLSLQMHYHRSEHWIVTAGTAKVIIGDLEMMVHENNSVFIPASTKHRLENPGKIPLEIIEVQNGKYLEEDDIVRFEDTYGRKTDDSLALNQQEGSLAYSLVAASKSTA